MSILVASSNPAREFLLFFFLPIFSHSFHDCREMKKVSIILLCILTCFIQLYSVIKHAHWTFIQNMAEKSALLMAMIKQFSILQNVIKVMVVLKKRGDG